MKWIACKVINPAPKIQLVCGATTYLLQGPSITENKSPRIERIERGMWPWLQAQCTKSAREPQAPCAAISMHILFVLERLIRVLLHDCCERTNLGTLDRLDQVGKDPSEMLESRRREEDGRGLRIAAVDSPVCSPCLCAIANGTRFNLLGSHNVHVGSAAGFWVGAATLTSRTSSSPRTASACS
jgi:hypothetical protein